MEILQDDADFPILKELKLEHFQQKYDWDCGISCILMILPTYKRTHLTEHLFDIAKEEGFLKSTWTIDLCYLLKRYNMKFVYYTITLGVNPGYSKNSFYSKVLTKDQTRVVNRFKNAKSEGVVVKKASVTLSQILHHLAEGWPVIVLTDASSLECTACRANRRTLRLRKCIPWAPAYIGHYVALCGYSMQTQSVFYRNPTYHDRVCVMSFDNLEKTRKSYGTDEDVIFIFTY